MLGELRKQMAIQVMSEAGIDSVETWGRLPNRYAIVDSKPDGFVEFCLYPMAYRDIDVCPPYVVCIRENATYTHPAILEMYNMYVDPVDGYLKVRE